MSVLAMLPGTAEWLLARLDLGVQLALRKELRAVLRVTDASYAGLFIMRPAGPSPDEVEWAGEHIMGPTAFPEPRSTMPSFDDVVCRDGEHRHAVLGIARLGRRMPSVGVVFIDPGGDGAGALEAVERAAERVEEIAVRALR